MNTLPPDFLRGSYPPLVTPFRAGEVDYAAFASLVATQIEHGSHGVVVTGTTGEPTTLTIEERAKLVETAVEVAKKRIPVVASTGSQSYAETLELSRRAERCGADALLIVTPYYSRPTQRGLVEYYIALGRQTSLPLLIHYHPERTGVSVAIATLERIADALPQFVGMKHSNDRLHMVTAVLEKFGRGFRVFAGLGEMNWPILSVGGSGLMNPISNIVPRKVVKLYECTVAGEFAAGRALHFELSELNAAATFETDPIPLKYMMKKLGILGRNEHRLPMVAASPELQQRLDGVLERAALIDQTFA